MLDVIEPVNDSLRQNILRRPEGLNGLSLDAQQIVRNLGGKVDLMEGHNDRDPLLMGHLPQNIQQLNLMADIQIGGRLVQNNNFRLLTDGPGQHDPLALSVRKGGKVPLSQIQSMDPLHSLGHNLLVPGRQLAHGIGIGVAAHSHHLLAGHQLRVDPVRQHHCHLPGQFPGRPGVDLLTVNIYLTADLVKMAGNGLENSGLAGAIGTDQRENLPFFNFNIDVMDEGMAVIAHCQILGMKVDHDSLLTAVPSAA